jgi:hypothetical protein
MARSFAVFFSLQYVKRGEERGGDACNHASSRQKREAGGAGFEPAQPSWFGQDGRSLKALAFAGLSYRRRLPTNFRKTGIPL